MATANTVTTKTGTGWTIDVTPCNLLADLSVKDFIVLIAGAQGNLANFTKTSQTILTYSGASLGAGTTIEVRRKTPNNVVQVVGTRTSFSSAQWNAEMDRIVRWREEADLNGTGPGFLSTVATPDNTAFPTGWSTDTTHPPSRQAVYTEFINRAKKVDLTANSTYMKNTGANPGNCMVQSDSSVMVTNGSGGVLIAFGVAFSAAPTVTCCNGDGAVSSRLIYSVIATTAVSFSVAVIDSFTGTAFANTAIRVNWIAVGAP